MVEIINDMMQVHAKDMVMVHMKDIVKFMMQVYIVQLHRTMVHIMMVYMKEGYASG